MITIIAALDKKLGIGYKGDLLTFIPGDLPRFQKLTTGNTVIMGRKTFDSLPNGPLKNRDNIVITRNPELKIEGAVVCRSLDEALKICNPNKEVFIIGGGQIYNQSLDIAERLLLTRMDKEFEADTFFPEIGMEWKLTESQKVITDKLTFSYDTYLRVSESSI